MAAASSSFKIEKLNEKNYLAWRYEMKMILIHAGLWKFVEQKVPDEKDRTDEFKSKNDEALATIALGCERSQHYIIKKCAFAREAWEALTKTHSKHTVFSRITLLKKLLKMSYNENLDMNKYLVDFEELFEECDDNSLQFPESFKATLILASLNDTYDSAVSSLASVNEQYLTLDYVRQKLLDEYNRRQERKDSNDERLMYSKQDKKVFNKPNDKKKVCWNCGSPDHFQNKCPKKKGSHGANLAITGSQNWLSCDDASDEPVTFMAYNSTVDDGWYLDSGATRHMSHARGCLSKLSSGYRTKIYMADGSSIEEEGIGQALLKCVNNDGEEQVVRVDNLLFVPGLKANLLSISQLLKNGLEVKFERNGATILKNGKSVAVADVVNGLFKLRTRNQALISSTGGHGKYCLHQWHRRFGHRDFNVVKQVVRDNKLKLEKCGINEVCECCLKSKMARQPFPNKAEKRTTEKLQLVHTDIMGPINPPSVSGKRYVMNIIDDYTRFTKIYLLQNKSEAAKMIESYVREVETKYDKKPQVIRSDNGGEYTGHALMEFYRKEGITAQFTVPYSPPQNGVAERKNRSLTEMVRCLLDDAQLPRELWGEAIHAANFLQNRMPSNALPTGKSPFELWHGYTPNYQNLRVYGCRAWVQVPTEKRTKLDSTSKCMTFIGYSDERKGHRFWDPETRKTVISRDAIFLELDNGSKQLIECNNQINSSSFVDIPVPADCENSNDTDAVNNSDTVQEESTSEHDEDTQQVEEEEPPLRRSNRRNFGQIDPYLRENYILYGAQAVENEPRSFKDAIKRPDSIQWKIAMVEEIESMSRNNTWDLVDLPPGKNLVGSKWVYKMKTDTNGNPSRYRARLVAQGFSQKYGVDYDEVFAPVVQPTTIRLLLTMAGQKKYVVRHMDVKSAFLNGKLEEEIYMKQPPGFEDKNFPGKVCKLNKSLYGLKQAARVWNERLTSVLNNHGYRKSVEDECLFIRNTKNGDCFVLLHVDDILTLTPETSDAVTLEKHIGEVFDITVLGEVTQFLGMKVDRSNDGSFSLSQPAYIKKVIENFGMKDAKASKIPMDPGYMTEEDTSKKLPSNDDYRSLIGALLYLSVSTRPDIAVATSILGRKVSSPSERDWTEAKRVLRYLKGTLFTRLELKCNSSTAQRGIVAYSDADWAGDRTDCKSNSGNVVFFNGSLIDWSCRKQNSVSTSSTEAEYIALSEACKELLWIRRLVEEVVSAKVPPVIVNEDNQSAIALVNGGKINRRSKHIETRFHFVRDLYANKIIDLRYCPTELMIADMMTKPLNSTKLTRFKQQVGLRNHEEEC